VTQTDSRHSGIDIAVRAAFFGLFALAAAIALIWAVFKWRGLELSPNFTATGLVAVGLVYLLFPRTVVRSRARTPFERKLQSLMFYGMGGLLLIFGLGALLF
jgi:hypothetical protein